MQISQTFEKKNDEALVCTTNAQNTEKGLWISLPTICVDWLQVTFPREQVDEIIFSLIGLSFSDFVSQSFSMLGYQEVWSYGSIKFAKHAKNSYAILQFSGQACREYESMCLYSWGELIGNLMELDCNITRIDLAYDDYKGMLSYKRVARHIRTAALRTRFSSGEIVEGYEFKKKELDSNEPYVAMNKKIITLGNRQSRVYMRMYDKKLEREKKGLVVDVKHWMRWEIEFKKENAHAVASMIMLDKFPIGEIFKGILKNYITFVDIDPNDSNRSRWKASKWYEKWIGDVEKIKIGLKHPEKSITTLRAWKDFQVNSTSAVLFLSDEKPFEKFFEALENGVERFSKVHMNIYNQFLSQNGMSDKMFLELEDFQAFGESKISETKKNVVDLVEKQKIFERNKKLVEENGLILSDDEIANSHSVNGAIQLLKAEKRQMANKIKREQLLNAQEPFPNS